MRKKILIPLMTAAVMIGTALTSFAAAGWQKDANGWWYATNDDGSSYYKSGWYWIDSDGDAIAECYYFDDNGYILTNTTKDKYKLNADGQWVQGENDEMILTHTVADGTVVNAHLESDGDTGISYENYPWINSYNLKEGALHPGTTVAKYLGAYKLVQQNTEHSKTMPPMESVSNSTVKVEFAILSNGKLHVSGQIADFAAGRGAACNDFYRQKSNPNRWVRSGGNAGYMVESYEILDNGNIRYMYYNNYYAEYWSVDIYAPISE